jgi:class 3 adenylate cyclase/tetratricopeptide (TPR) repeat protein
MPCPGCGHVNPPGSKFCLQCGAGLASRCAVCDVELPPAARFCNQCGAPVDAADKGSGRAPDRAPAAREPRTYTPRHLADKILQLRSALEGERKQVTVLFADVQGSMELAEQVDPETWHKLLESFFRILSDGVHRFEGTVNQYTGDGIMALFGAPIAHEDHAQRACYAALHLRDELARYATDVKRTYGLGFSTRIGINSGEVVVGSIGDDLRMDYTAQGHTVGLAKRMEALASPDACYVTGNTAALAGGYFEFDDLGDFRVKGVGTPVRVHRLAGVGTARTRFDVSRARGLTRFVGRDTDMATLEAALAQARAGHGQVVGVVAEAGAGKSRLCFEFVERCRGRGITVIEGQAVAHGKNLPLLPMLQAFRSYYGIGDHDNDRTVREKIAGRLLLLDEGFREVLPVLFDFFGVPDPARPPVRMDPEARQRLYFAVLRKVVQRDASSGHEYVTLIEDLHWLDPGSEAFLAEWVDAVGSAGRLLLVNFRPEYRADWMQKSYYHQIPLAPLGPAAIRELLADLLGGDPSTTGLAEAIHRRTGGNPFFTEEIVRSLIESGHLEGTRGAYRLVVPVERLDVPSTVQPLLAARIDRLAEREKRVLQTAAVIGREFSEPVLAPVVDLPSGVLDGSLGELKRAEFIYEQALYPVAEYAFKHPLTQEVALATQLREQRARNHAAVARVIEALHPGKLDEQAALLAHHWEEAGEAITAARWHRRAAEHLSRGDVAAGWRHWQRVRDLVTGRESDDEAALLGTQACTGLLSVGFRLGLSPAAQAEIYASGAGWVERTGSVDLAIRFEGAMAGVLSTSGECEAALRHALAAEKLAERSHDPILRANVGWLAGYVWVNTGPVDRACTRMDELIATAREHGNLPAIFGGEDMLSLLLQMRAGLEADCGDLRRARALADEALDVACERRLVESEGWACGIYRAIARFDGDVDQALPRVRRAVEIAEQIGSAFSLVWALDGLGQMLAQARDPDAVAVAERAVTLARERNTSLEGEASHLTSLAEACLATGDAGRACAVAAEAVEVAQRRKTRRWELGAVVTHARARLAARGAREAASVGALLDRATELASEIAAPNHALLIALERAGLAELQGDQPARERHLRDALEGFERIHAPVRVAQVRGVLGGTTP